MSNYLVWPDALSLLLLICQLPPTAILLSRLFKGLTRYPALQPQQPQLDLLGSVSVIVPTLNEAQRITPCLQGLTRQSYEIREIIIVDSRSTDGTPDLVKAIGQQDPRFRLINDDPLPPGWIGRPFALHTGFTHSSPDSQWILGIDADTQPHPGLAASLVKTAIELECDLISLSSQFILKYPGEFWLQPALLMTLIYRFGPNGAIGQIPERVMANGQCFLCRRQVLAAVGGYTSAQSSFCDDVTLARYVASQGYKVAFLDGSHLLKVRMYEGMRETWQEWGRSLDLKDASRPAQTLADLWLLTAVQALPLLVVLAGLISGSWQNLANLSPMLLFLLQLNLFLLVMRWGMCGAIAPVYDTSYTKFAWLLWLSPLADLLAVVRIFQSAMTKPTQWRGRQYKLTQD